jgi:hypothetical protein
MREKYEAYDGKIFDNRHDCARYELRLRWVRKGFSKYTGDAFYAARFLTEECGVSPSFAFFFTSAINKSSDRGFTSWLAQYFDDIVALGARCKSANEYLDKLNLMDRDKVLAQARSQEAGYKDPEINWEATLFSLKSKLNEDPDDPFMKAAIDFLIKDVDGFEEFWTTRSEDINEESD